MNSPYERLKNNLESEKGQKAQVILKAVMTISQCGVAIFNTLTLLFAKEDCMKYYPFQLVDESTTYFAVRKLSSEEVTEDECYIADNSGAVYTQSVYTDAWFLTLIGQQIIICIISVFDFCLKKERRKVLLNLLFFSLFLTFNTVIDIFILSNVNCDGECATMADSNRLHQTQYYAAAPTICFAFWILFVINRYCTKKGKTDNKDCFDVLLILSSVGGVIGVNVTNSVFLQASFEQATNIEFSFKIMVVFLILKSLYSLYKIYDSKKNP